MSNIRERITDVLVKLGRKYQEKECAPVFEIAQGHDVHAFYLLRGGRLTIHVQGYPGLSNDKQMLVSARLREYEKMIKERLTRQVSIGNEHSANLEGWFVNSGMVQGIPYSACSLANLLASNCEVFRDQQTTLRLNEELHWEE